MNAEIRTTVLATLFVLQGCSTLAGRGDDWAATLPPKHHFSEVYESDRANATRQSRDEYLRWVRSFYEGSSIYPFGFLDLKSAVLDGLDAETGKRVAAKLDAAGLLIGAEWAKDRGATRIHTSTLSVWGEALQLAAAAGQAETVTDAVSADVRALLSGEIAELSIKPDRYGMEHMIAALEK